MTTELTTLWELPGKSQEFMDAPVLTYKWGGVSLTYDYETDEGYKEGELHFENVDGIRFTSYETCTPEQVEAYDKLVEVVGSPWLIEIARNDPEPAQRLKHFQIFFDDVGCFEFLATSFRTD